MKQQSKMMFQHLLALIGPGALAAILTGLAGGSAFGQAPATPRPASGATVAIEEGTSEWASATFVVWCVVDGRWLESVATVLAENAVSHAPGAAPVAWNFARLDLVLEDPQLGWLDVGHITAVCQNVPLDFTISKDGSGARLVADMPVSDMYLPGWSWIDSIHVELQWNATGPATQIVKGRVDPTPGSGLLNFRTIQNDTPAVASGVAFDSLDGFNFLAFDAMADTPVASTTLGTISNASRRFQTVQLPAAAQR